MPLSPPKLDSKEEHFRIASYIDGLTLFLRYLPPTAHHTDTPKIVLYVHGGSFPSALSIAHRFDGRSWRWPTPVSTFGVSTSTALAPQTAIQRWRSQLSAIPYSVAPKGRAKRMDRVRSSRRHRKP